MREETLRAGDQQDLERRAKEAIKELGERWLLHPKHAPAKGQYNQWGRQELPDDLPYDYQEMDDGEIRW